MPCTYDNKGGVPSWIIVCAYSSQGRDMQEVLSVSIEAAMQVRNHAKHGKLFFTIPLSRYRGRFCYCFLLLCHLSQYCRLHENWANISKLGAHHMSGQNHQDVIKLYTNQCSDTHAQKNYYSSVLPKLHVWLTSIASESEAKFSTCTSFNIPSDLNGLSLWAFIHHQTSIHKAMNWGADMMMTIHFSDQ